MIHVSMGADPVKAFEIAESKNEELKAERDRYKAGLQDQVKYSSFPGTREDAARILDLSVELKRAIPRT